MTTTACPTCGTDEPSIDGHAYVACTIPAYVPPAAHLSKEWHGSYPQAARIASDEGHRSGGSEWWARIREIRAHWHETGQL